MRARAVWNVPVFLGSLLLAVAVVTLSAYGLSAPTSVLPVPLGVAIAGGLAGLGVLLMLRWSQQVALFALLAVAQVLSVVIGTTKVQFAVIVLVPLAIRVLLFTRQDVRPSWGWPEWTAIA
jgi:hypothetical protein